MELIPAPSSVRKEISRRFLQMQNELKSSYVIVLTIG